MINLNIINKLFTQIYSKILKLILKSMEHLLLLHLIFLHHPLKPSNIYHLCFLKLSLHQFNLHLFLLIFVLFHPFLSRNFLKLFK